MDIVTLDLFKSHIRLESDFALEDVLLQHLLDTAGEIVFNYINRDREYFKVNGEYVFPNSIKHAIMIVAAHLYNQKESVSDTQMYEVPVCLYALLKPYKCLIDESRGA